MHIVLQSLAALVAVLGSYLLFLQVHLRRLEAPRGRLDPAPPSRPGVWMMAHRADIRYPIQHLFLRLTPVDGAWAQRRPDLFAQRDDAGRAYCTLGAGPQDGRLVLAFNRPTDLGDPISFEEALPLAAPNAEGRAIEGLVAAAGRYAGDLRFSTWDPLTGPGYNCNNLMGTLCKEAGLPLARFTKVWWLTPGVGRRAPLDKSKA